MCIRDRVQESDLLLHVVDISHSNFEDHIESVNKILLEINCLDKPTILIFNKIDLYSPKTWDPTDLTVKRNKSNFSLEELQASWFGKDNKKRIFISAVNKENLIKLKEVIYKSVRDIHVSRFPYNNFLYPEGLDQY